MAQVPVFVEHGDVMELVPVPCLQGTVHTKVENTFLVLHHVVHIIAGKRTVVLIFFLENSELITIVAVDAVTCGCPKESLVIKINLSNKTARQ